MDAVRYLASFRWANQLSQLTGYLSAVALLLATFVTLHAVVVRYFLGQPTIWQTEVTIYLLMFVTFVGAAYGLKHHAHVGVDLLVERLSPKGQLVMRLFTAILSLAVVLIVAYTAYELWLEAYEGGFRSPTAWRAPLSVVYTILPVGMLLVACQYVAFIVEGVQALLGKRPMEDGVAMLRQTSPELAAIEESSDLPPRRTTDDEDPTR